VPPRRDRLGAPMHGAAEQLCQIGTAAQVTDAHPIRSRIALGPGP